MWAEGAPVVMLRQCDEQQQQYSGFWTKEYSWDHGPISTPCVSAYCSSVRNVFVPVAELV